MAGSSSSFPEDIVGLSSSGKNEPNHEDPRDFEDQQLKSSNKKMRVDEKEVSSEMFVNCSFEWECTVCKNSKTKDSFPPSSADADPQICKVCIGGLVGSEHFPSCRICGKIGECGCNQKTVSSKKCTKCQQMQNRNSFLDQYWFAEANFSKTDARICPIERVCMACLPNKNEEYAQQWMIDRSVVFKLMRYGTQIFDCESFLKSPDQRKFKGLPSKEEILGNYDIVYTRWETSNVKPYCMGDYSDFLLKRTISGSVQLRCEEEYGEGYESIVGDIIFDEAGYYEDGDLAISCPFGNIISFRFSGDENISVDETSTSIEANGEDVSCNVAVIAETKGPNGSHDFNYYAPRSSWMGSYGSKVKMQVIASRYPMDWIPRDFYMSGNPYAHLMRQEIHQRNSIRTDWSKSWLHSHMNLPVPIIQIIYDFISFKPKPTFFVEENDLLITINFEEYDSGLEVHIIARR